MAGSGLIQKLVAERPQLARAFGHILSVSRMPPRDVSDAVLFLASDESRYVTAHALAVDAGSI